MAVRVIRLGTPRAAGEGVRLGTVRRPPRGVPKVQIAKRDYYDVWLPVLAPSAELVALAQSARDDRTWATFARRYRREMSGSVPASVLNALAALSRQTDFAVGCYCEDERHCHRGVLRELLREHGAAIASG